MLKVKVVVRQNPHDRRASAPIVLVGAVCPLCVYNIPDTLEFHVDHVQSNMIKHLLDHHNIGSSFIKFKIKNAKPSKEPERLRHFVYGENTPICKAPNRVPRWFEVQRLPVNYTGYRICPDCKEITNGWERL